MRRRVVMTGMGAVTPVGHSVTATFAALLEGTSGVDRITHFDARTFPTTFAAEVKNFDLAKFVPDAARFKKCGSNTRFALAAAQMALADADFRGVDRGRVGVYLGAGEGSEDFDTVISGVGMATTDGRAVDHGAFARAAVAMLDGEREAELEMNTSAGHLADEFELLGPNYTCLTACAASAQALGEAAAMIRHGDADAMLAGGAHSMIHPFGVTGFNLLTALSTHNADPKKASRPFDLTRTGFVLGEGAGMIVLEEYEHARKRGATIYAELTGYGTTGDAYRMTDPHPAARGAGKKIIGIDFCLQLSPALNNWYQEFKKIQWPIKKGSLRLRVGPQGLKGAWLDFANLDIKMLLDEKSALTTLLKTGAIVEIGQKRKILKVEQDLLKLKDPESHLWFESLFQNQRVALFCHIASFTQPSMKANLMIVQQIQNWVSQSGLLKASEFGAGIGNLSLALLGHVESLRIFESDALSLECLQQTLNQSPQLKAQFQKINFQIGDHQQKKKIEFKNREVLVVNPPRSGLMGFIETLKDSSEKPSELIYLSCSPTSWSTDGQKLKAMGYQLKETFIVDQFPQTQHYEILSRWLF